MATIEAAKLSYLHKKILERYLEGPTADDEEILKLMDLQNNRPAVTYQAMGQQEHPIYARDRWLSEAAAKLTDDGYWAWVTKQINASPGYRYNGDVIVEVAPSFGAEVAGPSPFFTNQVQDPFEFPAAPPHQPMPTMAPLPMPTMASLPTARARRVPVTIQPGYSGVDLATGDSIDVSAPYSL